MSGPGKLFARIKKSGREEFRVTLKLYEGGATKAEIRVFEQRGDGSWTDTPRHIVVPYGHDAMRKLAEALLSANSLLSEGVVA